MLSDVHTLIGTKKLYFISTDRIHCELVGRYTNHEAHTSMESSGSSPSPHCAVSDGARSRRIERLVSSWFWKAQILYLTGFGNGARVDVGGSEATLLVV
jgi:hypothetical protein